MLSDVQLEESAFIRVFGSFGLWKMLIRMFLTRGMCWLRCLARLECGCLGDMLMWNVDRVIGV